MAKKAKKSMSKAARSARAKAVWAKRRANAAADIVRAVEVPASSVSETAFSTEGYEALAAELQHAFSQSAHGKGKHRHGNGRSFDRQPIMELGRLYGPGFAAGQAAKKVQEALGMVSRGETAAAIAEVHGGIVYLAALASLLRDPTVVAPSKK